MNILIAEDDVVSRRLLRGHLERWGHTVTESVDGDQAWQLFTAPGAEFPILVVDWMMPGLDGMELIRRVRAARLPRYTYLLMLTAKNQKEDIVRGMDAGADDYLTKPFDREELRARLQAGQRILELQGLLTQSEKSASVGRLAVGVAAEMAAPLAEAQKAVSELRSDVMRVIDSLSPHDMELPTEDDAPPRPTLDLVSLADVQAGLGPRFVATEQRLHRVRELARTLRDFASLDELPPRPVSLATLVQETVAMVKGELSEKSLGAQVSVAAGLPPVQGHPGKLKRAIYNVVSVMVEAAKAGGSLDVSLRLASAASASTSNGGGAGGGMGGAEALQVIEVAAETPDIGPDLLPAMFEPFALLGENGCKPSARATLKCGLGLPAAYSIVREHGGLLEAAPNGSRTVLRLLLPSR